MSIDCFAYNPNVDRPLYYTKMIVFFMIPIVGITFFGLLGAILTRCSKRAMVVFIKTSISTVLYILYPTMVAIGL